MRSDMILVKFETNFKICIKITRYSIYLFTKIIMIPLVWNRFRYMYVLQEYLIEVFNANYKIFNISRHEDHKSI